MGVQKRKDGSYEAYGYLRKDMRKPGEGAKRYLGRFASEAEAREVERLAKRGEYVPLRHESVHWTLNTKGETACRRCDRKAKHLHHIVPAASRRDLADACPFRGGIPLCTTCHIGWHRKAVTIFRDRLLPEEIAFALEVMGPGWLDSQYPARELYAQDINDALLEEVIQLRRENAKLRQAADFLPTWGGKPMTTTVLVCGSRDWADKDVVADALAELAGLPNIEIIHGGARGADRMAGEVAALFGWSVRVFRADWELFGKRAGFLRNIAMLDEKPNLVMAFQRHSSRGTQHTIDEARKRGIPVEVRSA